MRKTLKQHALDALKNCWPGALIAVFISLFIPAVIELIYAYVNLDAIIKFNTGIDAIVENPAYITAPGAGYRAMLELYIEYVESLKHGWLIFISDFFAPAALQMSIVTGFLAIARNKTVVAGDFVKGLKQFGTSMLVFLIYYLLVFVGLILFIVPGVYFAFAYSMVFYVKADNPDMSIRKCFKRSRELMNGKKMLFFNHAFSFIGWHLLAAVISSFASSLFVSLGVFGDILYIIVECALMTAVSVYWFTARSLFYEFNFVRPPQPQGPAFHFAGAQFNAPTDPFETPADPFDGTDKNAQGRPTPDPNNPNSNPENPFEF